MPGFGNWVPIIGNCKIFGHPFFKGCFNILRLQPYTLGMISLYNVMAIAFGWKIFNYLLEIDIVTLLYAEAILSSMAQRNKIFRKPSKPCHVGIHWIAPTEYSQS